jgi:hypothetical protein
MKLTMSQLKKIVSEVLAEAAPDGYIQKKYRKSFKRMIAKAGSGGNKNTPPFTKKAKLGKSGTSGNP